MIRPDEITCILIDDIHKSLSKFNYEEIEFSEYGIYIFIKAKLSYWDYLFEVEVKYSDVSRLVHAYVYCLTPVPREKRTFCLKLINFIASTDKEAKYTLCPYNHVLSGFSLNSILTCRCSIGQQIEAEASCLIEILSGCYEAIKHSNVKMCGINPIRFYNDFWKGTDYF
jgi:hypothetical protein